MLKRYAFLLFTAVLGFINCAPFEKRLPCPSENQPERFLDRTPYAAYFDYEEGLACAKATHRPILLIFDAWGCAGCHRMTSYFADNKEVMQFMTDNFVVVNLNVDDRTPLPEGEYISDFSGGRVRTIGNKNSDFQVKKFQTGSQPYYHILDLEGNELIEKNAYLGDKKTFLPWLKSGLDAF